MKVKVGVKNMHLCIVTSESGDNNNYCTQRPIYIIYTIGVKNMHLCIYSYIDFAGFDTYIASLFFWDD